MHSNHQNGCHPVHDAGSDCKRHQDNPQQQAKRHPQCGGVRSPAHEVQAASHAMKRATEQG